MQFQNEEEVEVELEVNETEDESGATTQESTEESEGEDSEDATGTEDTVTISKTELEKLQRESHAAKRLREKGSKKSAEKSNEEGTQTLDQELVERTFLAAQVQILDPEIQDEAMRLKDKLGFDSIAKAVNDPDVKMRLDNLIKQKKAQQSVAGGTGGSTQKGRGIEYHVAEYKRTGKLPDDPKLVSQILDKLV